MRYGYASRSHVRPSVTLRDLEGTFYVEQIARIHPSLFLEDLRQNLIWFVMYAKT